MAGGAAFTAVGVWTFVAAGDAELLTRIFQSAIPILVGSLLLSGGHMLGGRRGGITVTEEHLVLWGESRNDRLQIPLEKIAAIHAHEIHEKWGEHEHTQWYLEAIVYDGPRFIVGESDDEHELKHYGHIMAQTTGHGSPTTQLNPAHINTNAPEEAAPNGIEVSANQIRFGVGTRNRLAATLVTGGLSMTVVGLFLLIDIANNNVFGFLFGPLLIFSGVALVLVPLVKGLSTEIIGFTENRVHHHYELFGFKFGQYEMEIGPESFVRVRQRGLLGANLEIVSQGLRRHMAGSIHARTLVNFPAMMWIGQWLSAKIHSIHNNPTGSNT